MCNIYQHKQLQERQGTSLALTPSASANSDVLSRTKLCVACRRESTSGSGRTYVVKNTVFVLSAKGKPLTPASPAKARKLLKGGQAKKCWSKFNTFGIQMLVNTRTETPDTALGVDNGTKFEGYSVVCGMENNLSIKLDLPDKKSIVKKLKKRREARKARRGRLRRRAARWSNRSRVCFIAPSQNVLIQSRLKIISELCKLYPVGYVAIEDVRFNHFSKRWGANFSTVEIGKNRIREWFDSRGIKRFEYQGFETAELRKKYGYKKTSIKSADKFSAHCSDSLTLAVDVVCSTRVEPGEFLIVDDTYRFFRRKIHDSNIKKGGVREKYSCGTVFGLRKGLMIGAQKGKTGQLCGENRGKFRYRDVDNKRKTCNSISWVSAKFKVRSALFSLQGKPRGSRQP